MGTGQTSIDPDKVRQRLDELIEVSRDLDALLFPVEDQQGRQTTTTWTSVPSAASFAGTYQTRLSESYDALLGARDEVKRLHEELADTVKTMTGLDEQFESDLLALGSRLENEPERPIVGPPAGHPAGPTAY